LIHTPRGESNRLRAALFAALVIGGCSDDKEPIITDGGPSPPDAGSPSIFPSQLPPNFTCEPTLASLQKGIFGTSCAWDQCHGIIAPVYELELTAELPKLEQQLVLAPATSCKGWTRVVPGDLEHSFFWNKITEAQPACGIRMPHTVEPLPETALECVRGWIMSLAKD
jgi:hypothetical protein